MMTFFAAAIGTEPVSATGVSMVRNVSMMNGGVWSDSWMGGYGGVWMPLLLVIVLAGVAAWVVNRGGK